MHSQAKAAKGQAKKLTGANPLPFSPVPRDLLRDPELTTTDKVIAGLIMPWLKNESSGFVLNDILARDAGIKKRSVPRSLKRLEKTLWFRCVKGSTVHGRRRIIALWRTKDGLKAIKERLKRLKDVQEECPQGHLIVTPGSSNVDGKAKRKAEHRVQLASAPSDGAHEEFCASSPAFVPVVEREPCEDDDGGGQPVPGVLEPTDSISDDALEEMVAIAYRLPGMDDDDPEAWALVDRFADLSLIVIFDDAKWRPFHCRVARRVQSGDLAPVKVEIAARDFAARLPFENWDNPARVYASKIRAA